VLPLPTTTTKTTKHVYLKYTKLAHSLGIIDRSRQEKQKYRHKEKKISE
jgi:hypothetical protein